MCKSQPHLSCYLAGEGSWADALNAFYTPPGAVAPSCSVTVQLQSDNWVRQTREGFLFESVAQCWVFGSGTQLTVSGKSPLPLSFLPCPRPAGIFCGFCLIPGSGLTAGHGASLSRGSGGTTISPSCSAPVAPVGPQQSS